MPSTRLHVVVIGAGIAGAASAVELLRDGHRVTILDPGVPGSDQAASYGNGGWLSPSSVVPVALPGTWKRVPSWLADPLGPLAIRWSYLPRLMPWLVRFVRSGEDLQGVEAAARALRPLIADSADRHRALAAEAGVAELIERKGLLYVYPDRAAFEADALAWRLRRDNGVTWLELDADELRQQEPELDRRYGFGALVEDGGHCLDPGAYVVALIAHARVLGADLVHARALGLMIEGGRLRGVAMPGCSIDCDRAVVAAGAWSAKLAAEAGDRVSLETERGYHAVIADSEVMPRHPIMPSDGKLVTTAMRGGLRIAGQVELAGLAAKPNWRRAEIVRDFALRMYPRLPRDLPAERVKVWMGHRPSTPDSLPVIGRGSACRDVVMAFGHGHIGLASGAMTGRLVADLVAERPPTIDITAFSPARFRRAA